MIENRSSMDQPNWIESKNDEINGFIINKYNQFLK